MRRFSLSAIALVLTTSLSWAQAPSDSPGAVLLFSPLESTFTYLMTLDGQLVHSWRATASPGNSVYLLADGDNPTTRHRTELAVRRWRRTGRPPRTLRLGQPPRLELRVRRSGPSTASRCRASAQRERAVYRLGNENRSRGARRRQAGGPRSRGGAPLGRPYRRSGPKDERDRLDVAALGLSAPAGRRSLPLTPSSSTPTSTRTTSPAASSPTGLTRTR